MASVCVQFGADQGIRILGVAVRCFSGFRFWDTLQYTVTLKIMSTPFCASVLHAHNKGGPPDINISKMLRLSNFFELKRRVYIHLQACRTRKVLDIQLVYHILQI